MKSKKSKDNSWLWWVVLIAAFFLFSKCRGGSGQVPNFPFDTSAQDSADTAAEIQEGQYELERINSDPCSQDIMNGVPPEYQRCGNNQSDNDFDDYDS